MLRIDILSAYFHCGISALVGAAMLRLAVVDDLRLRKALRIFGLGLVALGLSMLPAGLGDSVSPALLHVSLTVGSLTGVVLVARGVGWMQGREIGPMAFGTLLAAAAAVGASQLAGPRVFGMVYALALACGCTLMAWMGRGFILGPRDLVERLLGVTFLLVAAAGWLRAGFTLYYTGPPRIDMLYMPVLIAPVIAALYGVVPIVMATLALSLVNTRLHQQLHSRAMTDELTGTMTRRALGELAHETVERAHRQQREAAVLMLDLDHFKSINDTYGHGTGDQVLRLAAATLQTNLRQGALLARYGGEEFVAVLVVDDLAAARRVAERLRTSIEGADWRGSVAMSRGMTVSVGVALVAASDGLEEALQRADQALYHAKREGRNRVQVSLSAA
jgi:diguanylate cyclase (GGDEF)-like protein